MSADDFDERPMTEAQWEAQFRESDLKAAKFGELLETLKDEPDGQVTIAREMGWHRLADALQEDQARKQEADEQRDSGASECGIDVGQEYTTNEPSNEGAEEGDDSDSWLDDEWDDDDDEFDDVGLEDELDQEVDEALRLGESRRRRLSRIPAYRAARSLAFRVSEALTPLMEGRDPDEDQCRLLGEAYISAHQAAVHIAGGHAMGYDDDVLCGNIVKNRMSLDAIQRCQAAWNELVEQQLVAADTAKPFLAEMREVQKLIEDRIAELRTGVWW